MKALFILGLLFTINCTCTFAQYIVVEKRIWSEADFATEGPTVETVHHTFFGDSVFNNKTYERVYASWTEYPDQWYFINTLIREENGKVFVSHRKGEETLLYDFNLQVGDEYMFDYTLDPFIVDSIVFRDVQSETLKHIYLSQESIVMEWVEKFGSYSGVFNSNFFSVGATSVLLCVEDQGNLIFQNETYNTCQLNGTYTGNNEVLLNDFSVFSTINNQVQVQNKNQISGVISFFDFKGNVVLKEHISEPTSQFCLPYSGLFIYSFQSENGQSQSGKIVVTD